MDINHLALDIKEWADEVFPDRTDTSMFLKLYGEISELVDAGDDIEGEVADVLIMVLDYALRKGVNPSIAIQRKMRINRDRNWSVNSLGVMQHVKGP
jgi:NTP pyrophosphatase (non-canonical NTP hydrolase)